MSDSILLTIVIAGLALWLLVIAYEVSFKVWCYFEKRPVARIKFMAGVYLVMLAGPSIWVAIVMGGSQ